MMKYSFPPNGLSPGWVNPHGKPVQPSVGVLHNAHLHQSPASSQGLLSNTSQIGVVRVDDALLEDMGSLKEILRDLQVKVDILMEAISLAHQKDRDGRCREDCWSCKILETMTGIRVAKKLGAEK